MDNAEPPNTENIDSELIGIIYEVAFDPDFWPDLLEGVSKLLENRGVREFQPEKMSSKEMPEDGLEQVQFFSDQLARGEEQRLGILLPHLCRALKLKREYNDTDHSLGQARAIIDQFPFGVLLVNAEKKLISANPYALSAITDSPLLLLDNNRLCITDKALNQQLKAQIHQATNNIEHTDKNGTDKQAALIKITENNDSPPVSLLISPDLYPSDHYDKQAENYAIIFIACASVRQKIAPQALQALFHLSPAEAHLAALLASGVSLNQAAEQRFIARNTAKVQLKSIFNKTGVSRQAELIKLILTSSAVFTPPAPSPDDPALKAQIKAWSHINLETHIRLSDGRRLQYAEYGDPQGIPIIHIHGVLGGRYERLPDDLLTRKLGVRLIIPDRPGYGLSDPVAHHSYPDFAYDLLELVEHLKLSQFSIMGLSVGAIYASAFAYIEPHKLKNIAMISSTPPFRSFADYEGLQPSLKLLIAFSKYLPTAAQMIARVAIKNACKDPVKFFSNIPVSTSDRTILSNPLYAEHFRSCLLSGSEACHSGFIQDIMISGEPWPFAFEDIQKKIDFWHGTQDTHSPLNRIMPVIHGTKNKQLHKIEGGGHFLIYHHWQEILQSLTQ